MAISQLPSSELTLGSTASIITPGLFRVVIWKRSSLSNASIRRLGTRGCPLSVTTPILSRCRMVLLPRRICLTMSSLAALFHGGILNR